MKSYLYSIKHVGDVKLKVTNKLWQQMIRSHSGEDRAEIDALNKLNTKLYIIGLLAKSKGNHRDCVVFCPKEGHGLSIKRVDNVKLNTGCFECGKKAKAKMSDKDFALERIPKEVRVKVLSISTSRDEVREHDRSKMMVVLKTKNYEVNSRLDYLIIGIKKCEEEEEELLEKHGEFVSFNMHYHKRKLKIHGRCNLTGRNFDKLANVKNWINRADEENRKKLIATKEKQKIMPWEVFKRSRSESKPANLVITLFNKYSHGLKPTTEKQFPGLDGDKRALRVDLYYEQLNIVIEVQSILHEKEIEYFGGAEGFKQRRNYDERKRVYFKRLEEIEGVRFYELRGDGDRRELEQRIKSIYEENRTRLN